MLIQCAWEQWADQADQVRQLRRASVQETQKTQSGTHVRANMHTVLYSRVRSHAGVLTVHIRVHTLTVAVGRASAAAAVCCGVQRAFAGGLVYLARRALLRLAEGAAREAV